MIYGYLFIVTGVTLHIVWTNYRDGDVRHILLPIFDNPNVIAFTLVICGVLLVGAP
jgi:hypothetical protein